MIIVTRWLINDESPDNPCIWSRGYLYPFFWCKWYLVSSFQICVGDSTVTSSWRHRQPQNQSRLSRDFSGACFESHSESNKLLQNNDRNIQCSVSSDTKVSHDRNCHMVLSRDTMGSHDIPIYSILKCSNRTKFTCISAYTCGGVTNTNVTFFDCKNWCTLIWDPLYFCASEFRSKAIWPTADNRLSPKRERL